MHTTNLENTHTSKFALLKTTLLAASFTALAACSGGGGNNGGSGTDTPKPPKPEVSIVTPQTFFKTGGDIRISGKHLKNAIVGFGPQNLSPIEQTDTLIKVTLPAGSVGAKSIKVGQNTYNVTFRNYYTKVFSGHSGQESCGLLPNKTVECWGASFANGPKPVGGLTEVKDIGLGTGHTCALLESGKVKCWGYNSNGQLGDNTGTKRNTPTFVKDSAGSGQLSNVTKLAVGSYHTCALINDGTVKCWGVNSGGQLGRTSGNTKLPLAVSGTLKAKEITAGFAHTCAILDDNSVKCWGLNDKGQLGDNTITKREAPVEVNGLQAKAISAGFKHTCAVLNDDTAKCWGQGTNGRLGDGSATDKKVPTAVSNINNVASISAGQAHTCARLKGNKVKCWGRGYYGRLGNNSTADATRPVDVVSPNGSGLLANVTGIVASNAHTCATFSDKPTHCWGANYDGQLGNATRVISKFPTPIIASQEMAARNINNAKQVIAGKSHDCAILMDNSVKCWGFGNAGQLGTGAAINEVNIDSAAKVKNIGNVKQVGLGHSHSCALLADKTIKCWGGSSSYQGELGDGNNKVSLAPVAVKGISNATQLSVAEQNGCALLEGGSVKCWGNNSYAQVGDGTRTIASEPKAVKNLSNVTQVATSGFHSCALLKDKTVKCWGLNARGQLGVARSDTPDKCSSFACSKAPVIVKGVGGTGVLSNVTQIAVGAEHTCALLGDGSIKCWGRGYKGQLGNNSTASSPSPVAVSGISTARKLALGNAYSCALLADKSVKCWGNNSYGVLGDGSETDRKVPVNTKVKGKADDISAGNRTLLLQGSLVVPVGG